MVAPKLPRTCEALRAAMLKAARTLQDEGGPDAIGLRAIARRVGVSPSAVYRYFPGRDRLLAALVVEGRTPF